MNSVAFTAVGRPKSKERPRMNTLTGVAYTPSSTREATKQFAAQYDGPKFEGPVRVHLEFYKDRTEVVITEVERETPSKLRGDIDNYMKLVLDALNGKAWDDDRQVVEVEAFKRY